MCSKIILIQIRVEYQRYKEGVRDNIICSHKVSKGEFIEAGSIRL